LRAAGKRITRSPYLRETATMIACPQDLSRVRGIGPVLETKLYAAGIGTFWELATLNDEELGRILEVEHVAGISLSDIKSSARHLAEDSGTTGLAWDGTAPDDLELLAGIGEAYERRLVEGGICTYRALAAATADELDAIIKPQGKTRPDYESWIAQAKARVDD
jgi:predicted flap endonuclease-1-like 5' DNA nuclease